MGTGGTITIFCERIHAARTTAPARRTLAALTAPFLVGGALALGALSAPRAARAQLSPVRLKVGLFQPSDGGAKNIAGSPLYVAEADLVIPKFLGPVGSSTLSAGYQYRSTHGNTLQVIPLTLSKTSDVANPASALTGRVYYGTGFGAYLLHAEKDGDSQNKIAFGGFGVVGYQLPIAGAFVELKYQLVANKAEGARPDGLLILLGKRL